MNRDRLAQPDRVTAFYLQSNNAVAPSFIYSTPSEMNDLLQVVNLRALFLPAATAAPFVASSRTALNLLIY
jgi:hypothetical protein